MLSEVLKELSRASQGTIQASLVISKSQGLTICSYYPQGVDGPKVPDEDIIAARSTQIQAETRKVFKQLERGALVRILVEGETGYVIICSAGDDAILAVLTNKRTNLGYLFFTMTRTANRIEKVLR
jgi:predicted regulator of Ras-like GTPase activity (Roadblock/LC7/MglB family)